ncbi:hypothetical protein KEM52_001974 [Ascosphaera acerosa]|nr:hypothetical protein KEM52_001974 [Ascosphaera acerosa]
MTAAAFRTTFGILFLYLVLKLLNRLARYTPLARPPESIQSGWYGHPPRAWWWFKQSLIYFLGLLIMKSCVVALIHFVPGIVAFGDWLLSWTEGNTAVQIFFVMLLFPVCMNALQYYIIDAFIKRKPPVDQEAGGAGGAVDDETGRASVGRRRRLRDAEHGLAGARAGGRGGHTAVDRLRHNRDWSIENSPSYAPANPHRASRNPLLSDVDGRLSSDDERDERDGRDTATDARADDEHEIHDYGLATYGREGDHDDDDDDDDGAVGDIHGLLGGRNGSALTMHRMAASDDGRSLGRKTSVVSTHSPVALPGSGQASESVTVLGDATPPDLPSPSVPHKGSP